MLHCDVALGPWFVLHLQYVRSFTVCEYTRYLRSKVKRCESFDGRSRHDVDSSVRLYNDNQLSLLCNRQKGRPKNERKLKNVLGGAAPSTIHSRRRMLVC